jgi:hypothetical protein
MPTNLTDCTLLRIDTLEVAAGSDVDSQNRRFTLGVLGGTTTVPPVTQENVRHYGGFFEFQLNLGASKSARPIGYRPT